MVCCRFGGSGAAEMSAIGYSCQEPEMGKDGNGPIGLFEQQAF
jgi:hypothetical protein